MKFTSRLLTLAIASLALAACNNPFSSKAKLDTDTQKFSYAIGVDIGRSMEPIRSDIDLAALQQGLQDVQEKKELALNDEERKKILTTMAQQLREKKMKEMEAKGKSATDAGSKYLADNGKRAGVTTTASGLQIETLKAGTGAKPAATSVVTVHYKGTLTNGTVFDSSYDRGQPATFPLTITSYEAKPTGVNKQDEEYVQITNPNAFAAAWHLVRKNSNRFAAGKCPSHLAHAIQVGGNKMHIGVCATFFNYLVKPCLTRGAIENGCRKMLRQDPGNNFKAAQVWSEHN